MIEQMQWNPEKSAYEGQWEDGRKFSVDGDVWAEELQARIAEMLAARSAASASEDELHQEAERILLDPRTWTDDMDGVEVELS